MREAKRASRYRSPLIADLRGGAMRIWLEAQKTKGHLHVQVKRGVVP